MSVTLTEKKQWRKYTAIRGGTSMICWFPCGAGVTPADANLLPRGQTLPDDTDAGIVAAEHALRDSVDAIMVVANTPNYYYAAAQNRTGVVTGVKDNGTTTVTATTPIFYPSIAGEDVVIAATGTFTVASYTSPTVIVVTGDATCAAKTITLTEGSRLMEEDLSDSYRWNRQGRWTCTRRYHCATGDRDAEVRHFGSTTYTFAADTYSVAGKVGDIRCGGKDPNFPHKALIEVVYEAPFNPAEYPVGRATIEMRTSRGGRRVTVEPGGSVRDIETHPDSDGYYFKPVAGTNEVPDGNPVYIIRSAVLATAMYPTDYETWAAMKGTINSDACPYIGGADAKELRMLEVGTAPHFVQDNDTQVIPIQWVVEFLDGGWDSGCLVERRRRYPKAKPVLHSSDDPTSSDRIYLELDGGPSANNDASNAMQRTVMQDLKVALVSPDDGFRDCYVADAWSAVNSLLSWNAP